ncbi:hypothetical protein QYE76_062691 [Lolium multiflorum]|uniref:CCHC-type domain-containing protein n=1 Tax=Lolium multiflorum TaxID=4521 RepID=A0AAD8S357_LOLMU|nr:hypothetical protein QYE76_062691 [Lolium multiflorum]
MSSVTTYAESVASCHAPTPIRSPSPAAVVAAAALPDARPHPVRRQLDFPSGGGDGNMDDDEDDDDFLFRAAEEMERSLHERRATQDLTPPPPPPPPVGLAPPTFPQKECICRRGPCDVEWKEPGGWTYVCSATPKCRHVSNCEQSDANPNSQPALWSHPEPNYPLVFNTQGNRMANATTQVNVSLYGAGARTPVTVSPQGAGAATLVNFSPQGAGATTPLTVSPQGAGAATPVNFSPQGAKSSGVPTCKCTAGKCRTEKDKGVSYYVCHIQKGHGACSHRVPVNVAAEELPLTGYNNPREAGHVVYNTVTKEADGHYLVMMGGHNGTKPSNPDEPPEHDDDWPFDIVEGDVVPTDCLSPAHPSPIAAVSEGSPNMLHQTVGMVELQTPTKSPMPPKYTVSPMTPRSNNCYRCGEEGHFMVNCPKNSTCYSCHVVGHWVKDCPRLPTER